jgi:hypothetical protein
MRHYDELARMEREGFEVIVDKTWEEISLRDCFDDTCHDIKDLERKVNNYELDWFMLRVRVLFDGHEMGSHYLGGCLYEDAREVLKDGTAEDCIAEALVEAGRRALRLKHSLVELDLERYAEAE